MTLLLYLCIYQQHLTIAITPTTAATFNVMFIFRLRSLIFLGDMRGLTFRNSDFNKITKYPVICDEKLNSSLSNFSDIIVTLLHSQTSKTKSRLSTTS